MWRHWWIVVLAVVIGTSSGLEWAARQPDLYEASTMLYLAGPEGTVDAFGRSGSEGDLRRHVRRTAELANSSPVRQRAVELTGGENGPGADDFSVAVEALDESGQIRISVTHPTPDGAVALANAVAIAHEQLTLERDRGRMEEVIAELERRRELLRDRSAELERQLATSPEDPALRAESRAVTEQITATAVRIEELRVEEAVHEVVVLREDATDAVHIQPRPQRLAAAGGLAGLVLGGAIAWSLNSYRHARLAGRDPRDGDLPAAALPARRGASGNAVVPAPDTLRVLGEIPDLRGRSPQAVGSGVVATGPKAADILGDAVDAILALSVNGSPVVVISSLEPAAGKTVTSINLAVAAVHKGHKVVVVDADRAKRSLSRISRHEWGDGVAGGEGAANSAGNDHEERVSVADTDHRVGGHLRASASPDDPERFAAALAEARSSADLVIVDGPTLHDPAAKRLMTHAHGTVIVDASGISVRRIVQVRRQLEEAGGLLVGLIINHGGRRARNRVDRSPSSGPSEVARPLGRGPAAPPARATDVSEGSTPGPGLPPTEERL